MLNTTLDIREREMHRIYNLYIYIFIYLYPNILCFIFISEKINENIIDI